MQIIIINNNIIEKSFNNKRKYIEKISFNIFTLEKNNYLNINYIFLDNLNTNIYLLNVDLNNYNILDIINKYLINLIIIDIIKLISRIVINSSYLNYFIIDYIIFIIYKKIYSRFIKNIKKNLI